MQDSYYLVDSDVLITAQIVITHLTYAPVSGRACLTVIKKI